MKLMPRRAVLAGSICCGAAVLAGSCMRTTAHAQPGGRVPVTVRLDEETGTPGVPVGQLIVNHYKASVDYQEGISVKLGPAAPGLEGRVNLPFPEPGFDRVIRVKVPNATRVRATLTVGDKTVSESVVGDTAMFSLHTGPRGQKVEVLSATELYQQNLASARAVALRPNQRPRKFTISTVLRGPGGNAQALSDGLQTVSALGINTVEVSGFGPVAGQVANAAAREGIDRFIGANYSPPMYFDWAGKTQNTVVRKQWIRDRVKEMRDNGVPLDKVVYYQVAEEPNWYFPLIFSRLQVDGVKPRFVAYLQEQGLRPGDFGAGSWAEVEPIMQSEAKDLPSRRAFYWTMRFFSDGAARGLKVWGDGLRELTNPNMLTMANLFNRMSRSYQPSPNQKIDNYATVGPNTAKGGLDWMEIGRQSAPALVCAEDWWEDASAPLWSYYGAVQYGAAREDSRNSVGGFIAGRMVGRFGPNGGKLKALGLVGQGGKTIYWGPFGPDPLYTQYSWSRTPEAYGAIAGANGLLAAAEDVLYPGVPAKTKVALLLPASAWLWDKPAGEPYYLTDMQGTYFALRHAGYAVDFVDEAGIEGGVLNARGYEALFVTAPNVTAKAQGSIASWVNGGGTAVFSGADAAGSDEYNTPVNALNQARGVKGMGREAAADAGLGAQTAVSLDGQFSPPVNKTAQVPPVRGAVPLAAMGGNVVGRFGNGSTAAAVNRFGRGTVYSFGFRPGSTYWKGASQVDGFPAGFNAAVRAIISAPLRARNVSKPVTTSGPLVVASRLDSRQGTAIVLLNWSGTRQEAVQVTVPNPEGSRISLASGAAVQTRRQGDEIIATVSMAKNDADVLLIRP